MLVFSGCGSVGSSQPPESPATQPDSNRQEAAQTATEEADAQAKKQDSATPIGEQDGAAPTGEQDSATLTDSGIVVDIDELGQGVTFVPYDEDGSKVQLLLARVGDDVSVKLDTCNSCNGSPKAYYAYDGAGTVTCQNCGFEFAIDELDQRQGGCSPMDVEHEIADGQVRVSAETLSKARPLFAKIVR